LLLFLITIVIIMIAFRERGWQGRKPYNWRTDFQAQLNRHAIVTTSQFLATKLTC
jgi:hypothetical protein